MVWAWPACAGSTGNLYFSVSSSGLLTVTDRSDPNESVLQSETRESVAGTLPGLKIYELDTIPSFLPIRLKLQPGQHIKWDPRFDTMIANAGRQTGIDALLIKAIIKAESGFNPAASSPAGAIGLMQLLPATARRYGVYDLLDPEQNIRAGSQYLADLLRMFRGDVSLALAGYNAGEQAVVKHGYRVPPYRETQAYVPHVQSLWQFLRGLPPSP